MTLDIPAFESLELGKASARYPFRCSGLAGVLRTGNDPHEKHGVLRGESLNLSKKESVSRALLDVSKKLGVRFQGASQYN